MNEVIYLTKEEIKTLLTLTLSNFPHMQEKAMKPTVALWEEMLSDIPFDVGRFALKKVLSTSKFWPNVADIRKAAAQITNPQLSPAEAWGQVIGAVQRFGYNQADKGILSLSPVVRQAVRAFGGFTMICHSENIDATRAQFMRIYEQYSGREKELATLPADVRQFMLGAAGTVKELPAG